jgi:DNA polymerase-3 subunit gamma/tau
VVRLGLKNPMQEAEILKDKSNLFTFLKTQLKNAALTLDVYWLKEDETVSKAFTATDKFKLMMDQNPSLAELKRLFDLDLD